MDGSGSDLLDRVHGLSDLELAIFLSLVSHEHCVIGTPVNVVDELVDEVGLISESIFGLRHVMVNCDADTTLEDFSTALLLPATPPQPAASKNSSYKTAAGYFHSSPVSQAVFGSGPRPPASATGELLSEPFATAIPAGTSSFPGAPVMANIVIARNLNCAPESVQIQALELMHTRRIFTTTTMQAAPRQFLLVAVVAAERGFLWTTEGNTTGTRGSDEQSVRKSPHMTGHLNDAFFMGHWHDPEDGFPNLEERHDVNFGKEQVEVGADGDSIIKRSELGSQVLPRSDDVSPTGGSTNAQCNAEGDIQPLFSNEDIEDITALSEKVRTDVEVLRYQMNVVAFLRIHRSVAVISSLTSGISCVSPNATRHFKKLSQCLAPLHKLDYVTPALVALAARKTYLHRICTVPVGHNGSRPAITHERSMQWGSDKAAVEALLEGVSPEDVIEDVLGSVVPPV